MSKEENKEKLLITELIQRILFTLSMINLFLIFPYSIYGMVLSYVFQSEDFIGDYKTNILILAIYGIISLTSSIVLYIDKKNKGKNLIKDIAIIFLVSAIVLIIAGILKMI